MLPSFYIKNFRLFRELYIPELRQINLIVGRNNSGKSALLEAMHIYASNIDRQILLNILDKRQETWINPSQTLNQKTILNPIRHLFYNYKIPLNYDDGITIGLNEKDYIQIGVGAYQTAMFDDDIGLTLIAVENGNTRQILKLDHHLIKEMRNQTIHSNLRDFINLEPKYITQLVSSYTVNEKLSELWESISLTDLEQEVMIGLQILEPSVVGVDFVDDRTLRRRLPRVKMSNISEPLPLRSMGDGIMRIFHIILALVNAKNGILLIDEFENGLHWSTQPKIWKMIFRLSEALNVQVFASTHSRDCIRGYEQAWNDHQQVGTFFRLNWDSLSTTITTYDHETLADALEMDVEVR